MCGKRINGFCAVSTVKGRVYSMNSTAAKSESSIRFIETLMSRHRWKTLWIYIDNPPVHISNMLKKWLATHQRVVLTLPRYSPDINPQEQWWNYESAKLFNNTYASNRRPGGAVQHSVRNTLHATVKSV
jgi:transposase